MTCKRTRKTVTFDPDDDVNRMLERACNPPGKRRIWGYRSFLINSALREHLKKSGHSRKKDQ
jgi:hypothetical protein